MNSRYRPPSLESNIPFSAGLTEIQKECVIIRSVSLKNNILMFIFTAALGAAAGGVIWCFMKAVGACTALFWEVIPESAGSPVVTVFICAAGGLALGFLHKRFGSLPDELPVVMSRIKKDKHYDYRNMPGILICAFIPLVLGASVGPEAGLVGIIAGLCYWIGDNVTYAKNHTDEFSEIGEAVTLGQIFRSPLFGIFAVEESEQGGDSGPMLPKPMKLLYYGISTAVSFLVIGVLNNCFGAAMGGFPRFSEFSIEAGDYLLMLLYIPVGVALYLWFEFSEKLTEKAALMVPDIVREIIAGAAIGVSGLFIPMILFSGEESMGELMDVFGLYTPAFLILICVLKVLMTAFCIRFGWKGGHFFPLIFACSCMGFALPMLIFADPGPHAVFAAGVITAATLGAQMKKPLAVTLLLLLCFPVRMLFWVFLAALAGSRLALLLKKSAEKMNGGI